jgi:hypothetical protein
LNHGEYFSQICERSDIGKSYTGLDGCRVKQIINISYFISLIQWLKIGWRDGCINERKEYNNEDIECKSVHDDFRVAVHIKDVYILF